MKRLVEAKQFTCRRLAGGGADLDTKVYTCQAQICLSLDAGHTQGRQAPSFWLLVEDRESRHCMIYICCAGVLANVDRDLEPSVNLDLDGNFNYHLSKHL